MAFLQIIPLVLLLLDVFGSILCGEFSNFSCEAYDGERGKNTNITCKNNQDITAVTVKFCPFNESSCPDKSEISTFKGNYTSDDGRISLQLNNFAILFFNKVEISDKGYYKFHLFAENGDKDVTTFLKIVAPYTKPQLTRKNDTVVCTAAGGYPHQHLYWYDDSGKNLTHNSTCVPTQSGDGSFSLSSSLQLDSPDDERTYCCTLDSTGNSHPSQTSDCMTFEKVQTEKMSAPESTTSHSILIPILLILTLAVVVAVAVFLYHRKKKGVTMLFWQRDPVAYQEREFPQDCASHIRELIAEEPY